MPLDSTHTNPMYVVGRLAALAANARRDDLTGSELDSLLITPLIGLAKISADLHKYPDTVRPVMDLLDPSAIPTAPIPIAQQGPFWVGYYHQQAEMRTALHFGPEELRRAGELLFGERWQTDLAEHLRLHDASRVRAWLSERARVPAGVALEVLALLRQRSRETKALADELDAAATWRAPAEAPGDL